jgi:hypothetical protein
MSQQGSWIPIKAKFNSKCIICDGEILEGDLVLWSKGTGVKHDVCPTKNESCDFLVIDQNFDKPKTWKDPNKYDYATLQKMTNCQACGKPLDRNKSYIEDDRKVCVECFAT